MGFKQVDIGTIGGGIDRHSPTKGSTTIKESNSDKPFTVDDLQEATIKMHEIQKEYLNEKLKKEKQMNSDNEKEVVSVDDLNSGNQSNTESNTNPGGLEIAIRDKVAVNMMRVNFPSNIVDEINQHIDDVVIPENNNLSHGLVGQINSSEKSKQLLFNTDDEVGEQLSTILQKLASQFYDKTAIQLFGDEGKKETEASIDSMWTVHSYAGDYNPLHDHGTKSPKGLSCIMFLKVPPQIEKLDNPSEKFSGLNNASGVIDGFTYFNWGANGMRDVNFLRPVTEEYVKPEVGMMVMFPSWLRHAVMPFSGEGERRTLSANISINVKGD